EKTIVIPAKKGIPAPARPGQQEAELEFWRSIKDGNDPEDFELYVQQFPNGIYAALAKRKMGKLRSGADATQAPTGTLTQTIALPPAPPPAPAAAYTQTIALTSPPPAQPAPHSTVPPAAMQPAPDIPPPAMEHSSMPMMLVVGVAVAILATVGWFAWKPTPETQKTQAPAQDTRLLEAQKREAEERAKLAAAEKAAAEHAAAAQQVAQAKPVKETAAEKAAREKAEKAEAARLAAAKAAAEKEAAAAAAGLRKA